MKYSACLLREMPTLSQGQTDDLKIDEDGHRVWLARTTIEDGELIANRVSEEVLIDGAWILVDEYDGGAPYDRL